MAKRYTIAIAVVTSGVKKSSKNIRELGGAGATAAKGINLVKTAAVGIGALMASEMAQAGMALESLKSRLKDPEAFNTLNQFAKDTGQAVENVVNGYIKLRNLGIDPTMERMRAFGNVAAAQGKSLEQFVEAVADAATNEFERLKEFGIKTRQEADSVVFTFQGVQTRVGKNSDAIVGYLEDIGNVDFAGELERQAQTTAGQLESLKGELKDLASAMWEGGLRDATRAAIAGLSLLTDWADKFNDASGGLRGTLVGLKSIGLEGLAKVFSVLGDEQAAKHYEQMANEASRAYDAIKNGLDDAGSSADKAAKQFKDLEESVKGVEEGAKDASDELQKAVDRLVEAAKTDVERAEDDFNEAGRIMGLAIAEGMVDEETRKKVMDHFGLIAAEAKAAVGEFDATSTAADPGAGTSKILRDTERIGDAWDEVAYTVTDIVRMMEDGSATWIDYLQEGVRLWQQISAAQAQSGGSGGTGGAGGSAAGAAAGSNPYVALFAALYSFADAYNKKKQGERYSRAAGVSAEGYGAFGQGRFMAGGSDRPAGGTEISYALAEAERQISSVLDAVLQEIGGFVEEMGTIGIQVRADGEEFRATLDGALIGVFSSMGEAINASVSAALQSAEFSGIGDNVRAALESATSATTLEELLSDINLGRWVDELGLSDFEVQLKRMSDEFLRASDRARKLGMDVGAISEGFLAEMGSIRDRILGIHKSEYEQRLDDAEAYNRQIQERIADLKRYMEQLAAEPVIYAGGGLGGLDGGPGGSHPNLTGERTGDPNGGPFVDFNAFQQTAGATAGALVGVALATESLGNTAEDVAGKQLIPSSQAIADAIAAAQKEIADLEGLLIDPSEVKKGGGGGSGRRDAIKRLNEEIERLARVAGGPVTNALFAVNDNFDRLEEEARRLRQPLDEIVALREREVEALKEQARNDFTESYLGFINNWGEIEQAMVDFGQQANAVRDQIDDLLEAGVINAEQAAALLDEVQTAQNSKFGAYVQDYANQTLLQLYDYLGDEEASAKLRWELAQAEMEMRLAQLEIAREQGHLSADTLAYIREQWAAVLASGDNPFEDDGSGGGDSGGGTGSTSNPFYDALARLGATDFRSIEDLLSAWAEFTTEFKHHLTGFRLSDAEEVFAGAVDAIEEVLVQPIRDLRDEILADELGPLSARERFERMQDEYRDVVARAQGGDLAAIQEYEQVARQFRQVYQEFHGNAAAGFLDAQILSMIQQLEGLDLTGDLNFPGRPIIDATLGEGGPVSAGTRMMVETIDMHGTETVTELRALNNRMERIERYVRDGSLQMTRWQRTGTRG